MNQTETPADRHMNNQCREVVGGHCHCTLEYGMPEGQRRDCMVCEPTNGLIEYASGVESVQTWDTGDRCDMTVEVSADEAADLVSLGGNGSGWAMTIEQAQELTLALQEAILTAKVNRRRM